MKMKSLFLLLVIVFLLSGCSKKIDDVQFVFPDVVTCNENAADFVELNALDFPSNLDGGYLYSYIFDYGQFYFVFHNPELVDKRDEFLTRGAFGNQFHNDDGAYLRTEIPEGYYLYGVTYKYASSCRDGADEEKILTNLDKSFLYYSQTEYSESEFLEAHSDLFE